MSSEIKVTVDLNDVRHPVISSINGSQHKINCLANCRIVVSRTVTGKVNSSINMTNCMIDWFYSSKILFFSQIPSAGSCSFVYRCVKVPYNKNMIFLKGAFLVK